MAETLYPSRLCPGKQVPVAVWLAEFMINRQAQRTSKEVPKEYWKYPDWERQFKLQLRIAKSLLKLYSPSAISAALKTTEGKRTYSLSAPWLDAIIMKEQRRIDFEVTRKREAAVATPTPSEAPAESTPVSRPAFIDGSSVVSKLKGL